jgi:hypothetical protein
MGSSFLSGNLENNQGKYSTIKLMAFYIKNIQSWNSREKINLNGSAGVLN